MKKYLFVGSLLVIMSVAGSFVANAQSTPTPTPTPSPSLGSYESISGYAWSSNTGWLSFNSTDSGAGGGSTYSVSISTTSSGCSNTAACFSGYAWSPNIGWVSFMPSDIATSPACPGSAVAHANLVSGGVTGYIRALSGTVSGAAWNGCIALSGTNFSSPDTHGYDGTSTLGVSAGVDPTNTNTYGAFTGFGWENNGIGWINFAPAYMIDGGIDGSGGGCHSLNGCGGIVRLPKGGGSGSNLAVSCSGFINSSNDAVWSATASGGTGSYTKYTWGSSSPNGTATQANPTVYTTSALSPSQTATAPSLMVTDSGSNTATGSCGSLQAQSPVVNGNAGLFIAGGTVPPTAGISATIKKGQPFVLGWNIGLSQDYTCTPNPPSPDNGLWDSWGAPISSGGYTQIGNSNSSPGFPSGIPTSAANPGQYTFSYTCTSNIGNTSKTPTATLIITDSSEVEI